MTLRPAAAAALLTLALAGAGAWAAGPMLEYRTAMLQGLDKVTARVSPLRAPIGTATRFGTLEIVVRACRETPPTEPPESAAFLEIRELPPASEPDAPPTDLFKGWMFASSPAVSALEHPVYDVWVTGCEDPAAPPPEGVEQSPLPPPAAPDQGGDQGTAPQDDQGVDEGRAPPSE